MAPKKTRFKAGLFALAVLATACGSDHVSLQARRSSSSAIHASSTPTPFPLPPATPSLAPALVAIRSDYESYVHPLVQKACMDCHDAHAVPDGLPGKLPIIRGIELKHIREASAVLDFSRTFPAWSDASSDPAFYLSQLKGVLNKHTMPPSDYKLGHEFDGKLLKDFENQVILNWISNAEKILASVNTNPPAPGRYFAANCLGCHNSNHASAGFQFQKSGDDWTVPAGKTKNGVPYLSPGSPENSAVYLVLLNDASKRKGLPEMPEGGSASPDDQKLIYDWIKGSN